MKILWCQQSRRDDAIPKARQHGLFESLADSLFEGLGVTVPIHIRIQVGHRCQHVEGVATLGSERGDLFRWVGAGKG